MYIKKNQTENNIPVPNTWKQASINFMHDKYKFFNLIILLFAVAAGSFIIFSTSTKELNVVQSIEFFGIKTYSTLQFIMLGNIIVLSYIIIHANYLLHILYEHIRKKKE